jgi:hypothetical protein
LNAKTWTQGVYECEEKVYCLHMLISSLIV